MPEEFKLSLCLCVDKTGMVFGVEGIFKGSVRTGA